MAKPFTFQRILFFAFLAIHSLLVMGQNPIVVRSLDVAQLPKGIHYEGKIKTAVSWKDNQGDNIVLLTATGIHTSTKFTHENNGNDAELFAYHFILNEQVATPTWKMYDFISDCPVDLEANFINNTFQVTDLNKDGIGEIWIMYKTVCHGDVSPLTLKIIMYHGKQKFALRGQSKVLLEIDKKGVKHYDGGTYTVDRAFKEGPKEFLAFAKTMWQKNVVQELGE